MTQGGRMKLHKILKSDQIIILYLAFNIFYRYYFPLCYYQ